MQLGRQHAVLTIRLSGLERFAVRLAIARVLLRLLRLVAPFQVVTEFPGDDEGEGLPVPVDLERAA